MSRREDSKARDATITVDIEDFTRTRDSVVSSLVQLSAAVSELTKAYMNHADTVLGRTPTSLDISSISGITGSLYESGLLGARPSSPGAKSEVGEKKKRKRAPPDPNAPKRALTPFFLYMQHNRSRIAEELGSNAKPKEVSDEGTRRWAEMPEVQKEVWKKLYADNLAVYKEKVKAYKAGLPYSDDAKAASQLHQGMEGAEATDVSDEEEQGSEAESEEESSPEPVREPTPPRTKRRRSEGKPAAKEVSTPSEKKRESPEKKKRGAAARKEKEEQEAPASTRKAAAGDNKRANKKKRKSEAGAEE
ncbi:HMG box protein [Aspergillus sclerotiicarbonarius CBS 121057]|uniref:HMG box protein n=1 Tax=Aspergillus sclerotiicarbonarius (strain CBS 121057 / IBT 28362) TaxID=1448318 RepID=A0A319E4K9_ASPSB|nr:HMG box protein [Aspergillus sclerotiicarbonarius CBS 121057]